MIFTRWTAGLAVCAGLIAPLSAQGKPFKHALPAKTLMFVSAPDLASSAGEFHQTSVARMWREEEVQDFAKDALLMAEGQWAQGLAMLGEMHEAGQVPVSPDDIRKVRVHSFTAALTSLELEVGAAGPLPKVGILAHLDVGDSVGVLRKLIHFGAAAMAAEAPVGAMEKSMTTLEGNTELLTISVSDVPGMSLNIAFMPTGIIVGTLTDEVKAAVTAVHTQQTILPTTADYAATSKHLGAAGAEIEGYIHVDGCMNLLMDVLGTLEEGMPEWPAELQVEGIARAVSALGLRSVRATGFTSKYEGQKSVTRSFSLAPEAGRKGFLSGTAKAADLDFLRWVPKEASSVSTSQLDIQGIYDGLVGALKAYNPEMADMLLAQLAEQEEMMGLSLKDDLFSVFGDQMVFWSMGVSSLMSAPEGAMLLKVRDQERLLGTLNKIAAMTGGVIDFPVSERRGVKTWRLELDPEAVPEEAAAGLAMFQPCFAFKDGYMVLALSTGDVRRTIKSMGRESDPATDIRSNKDFAGYMADLQQQKVSGFAWTDWKVTFESAYSAVTSALALMVNDEDVPFNMTLLPEAESLSQHLFSAMTWSTATKEGYLSTSVSPLGPEVMIGSGLLLVTGAAVLGWVSEQGMVDQAFEISGPDDAAAVPVERDKKKKK